MDIEIFKQVGMTNNEALVYQALLKSGPNQAGRISRLTGIHRRTIYDTIEMLIKKGLVGYILKNNKREFSAVSPKRLLEIVQEKENSISKIMPEMISFYQVSKEKQETNFYKGKEGLKTVFEDQIEEGKEILILGANSLAYEILQFYFKWFDKRRKEKKIKTRIIFNNTDKKIHIPLSEIRYLPEKYSSPLAINIYGDKTAIIFWRKENPIAIVIKDRELAESYKKHFELVWRVAKP